MITRSCIYGIISASLFASMTMAASKGYICDVAEGGEGGFVASPIVVVVDPQKKEVVVSDPIILWVKGQPLAGDFKALGNGKYRVRWRVTQIPTRDHMVTAYYSAVLDPSTSYLSVTGRVNGGTNQVRGAGKCKDLQNSQIGRILGS